MDAIWIVLIVVLVLIFIVILGLIISIWSKKHYTYEKDVSVKGDIHPVLKDIKILGYVFLNEDYIKSRWTDEEIDTIKYLKRPFLCITSSYLKSINRYLIIPESSKVKAVHYLNQFYTLDNSHKLIFDKALIVSQKATHVGRGFIHKQENIDKVKEYRERAQEIAGQLTSYWKSNRDTFKILTSNYDVPNI